MQKLFYTISIMLAACAVFGQSLQELNAQFDEAQLLKNQKKYAAAEKIYLNITPRYSENGNLEKFYESSYGLAVCKYYLRDADEVLRITSETLAHCEKNSADSLYIYTELLRYKGRGFFLQTNKDSSIFYLKKASEVFQKYRGDNDHRITTYLNNIAFVYKRYWDNQNALKYYEESRAHDLRIKGSYNDKTSLIDLNIGQIYNDGGRLGMAEKTFQRIRAYHESVGDTLNLKFAQLYADFGSVYRRRGWYDVSLNYYMKAITLMEQLAGSDHPRVLNTCRLIAFVHARLDNAENALKYINRAVETNRVIRGDMHYETINALIAKALITMEIGELEESISISRYLIGLFTGEQKAMQNFLGLIYDYLGEAQMRLGKHEDVIQTFEKSLEYCESAFGFDNACVARARSRIAKAYSLMGQFEKSDQYYQLVLEDENFKLKEDGSGFSFIDYLQAVTGKIGNAHRHYLATGDLVILEGAINFAEELKPVITNHSSFLDQSSYRSFLDMNHNFNIHLLSLYAELYKINPTQNITDRVYETFESNKAFVIVSKLINEEKYNYLGVPDSLVNQERNLKMLLSQARNKDQTDLIVKYTSALKDLIESFKTYPDYYNLKYNKQLTSVSTIQNNLLVSGDLLIHYLESDSALFAVAITKMESQFFSIPLKTENQDQLAVLNKSLRKKGNDNEIDIQLTRAYDQYFLPVQKFIDNTGETIKNIHVIKDGYLNHVPLGLLKDRNNQFLLASYNISEHISASIWEREYGQSSAFEKILGVAPTFASAKPRNTEENYPEIIRSELDVLPGAIKELDQISQLFPVQSLTGESASETNVLSEIGKYNMLHFATHAVIDSKNPDYSKLVLSGDANSDGYLHSFELYNLKLNAELVTLSACNTGFGQIQKGEGVMSLSRAFAFAGCPNIVMSLWPVNDESTAELMGYFYQNLKNGKRKDEALRQAKLTYVENADPLKAHPYYWAGFVFTGDPQPIQFRSNQTKYSWYAAIVGFLIILGFVFRKKI